MKFSGNGDESFLHLPSFFSGDFLGNKAKTIFQKGQKLTLSGVPNISGKLFVLQKVLDQFPQYTNILFVVEKRNEMHEVLSLAPLFLACQNGWKFYTLPDEKREREKIEWILHMQYQKTQGKNIFFMSREEVLEYFPDPKKLQQQQIILEKKNTKISPVQLIHELIGIGYELTPEIFLDPGEYRRSGNVLDIFPVGAKQPVKVEISYDEIENIFEFSPESKKIGTNFEKISLYPAEYEGQKKRLPDILQQNELQILCELDEMSASEEKLFLPQKAQILEFSSFPENEETSEHLRFLSVLKFYNLQDLLLDFREKIREGWKVVVLTKRKEELKNILQEENISFSQEDQNEEKGLILIDTQEMEVVPPSFQNQQEKICLLTDREIFHLHGRKSKKIQKGTNNFEFLTSLKIGDLVVHLDHGIGRFLGICEQEISGNIREYLEISYAQNDKLFVPVDQADKVSRFISEEGEEPKLTRLGGVEWKNIQKKVKKETQRIAKELLNVYAARAQAKGITCAEDTKRQQEFEAQFPYEETPGQIAAIKDIKNDLESGKPMDRLLCGDVGFGKTEVAMRAAFKVLEQQKQVVVIAPITILVHQHFQTFQKRMEPFGIKIEMLSRFRTKAEQKKILEDLKKGKIDIVIGTHRLLGQDVAFYDLGLVIIDEEQRFGVQQKERFKKMRSEVSILTLSATPIPRTLNLAMHKLRDISTITTPPPGRLPIITEVRKYSDHLIRDAIMKEMAREGQTYFLHNRVETIEAIAHKLRMLIPEAKFVVAHGQMKSQELEDRVLAFKEKKYDVLISSTIVENGIDLANANTMIVNNAERFGLAQLYQLRGRIGRSKKQAYAYLLHSAQKLSLNAKKRLKALIEATELGSGFQLSMRDLEIRGAGDILGVNQHGTVNIVGISHFLRLLNQTIKEMQQGQIFQKSDDEDKNDVLIELPVDAYIPGTYIADSKEKILTYQKLAAVEDMEKLKELEEEVNEEYGKLPKQVRNLFWILELKIIARQAHLKAIKTNNIAQGEKEVQLMLSKKVTALEIMNLLKYQSDWMVSGETLKIPMKKLGIHWKEMLQEALQYLLPTKK